MKKTGITLLTILSLSLTISSCKDQTIYNGHEYVDLGLSVKWATCNVGAQNPEDYGGFFAWGETESKSNFLWENYRFYVSGDSFVELRTADNKLRFSKYTFDQTYHDSIDNKTILDLSDDVAHVQWGGNWRMPTKEESKELIDDCTWTWTIVNGVNGYKVTSNKPGYTDRSIFLPAAGAIFDTIPRQVGSYGAYWINSLQTVRTVPDISACTMEFHKGQIEEYWMERVQGLPVRPVCP